MTTYRWQGDDATDPTNWHVAANWDLNMVPTDQDVVVIPSTAYQPVVKQVGQTAQAGDLTIEGSAVLTINPGFTLNVSRKLTLHDKITGGGTAVIEDMDWHSGSLNNVQATLNGVLTTMGSGRKYVVYGTTLTVAASAHVVQEATGGNISFYGTAASPATIENLGTWELQGNVGIDRYYIAIGDTRGTFHNAPGAVFKKTGGAGASSIEATFDNDGIVEVHTDELELEGRDSEAISSDGRFQIKTDATLVLTRGGAAYSYYVGPTGVIEDFPPDTPGAVYHGNLRFELGANVVDGEVNISGSTVALSNASSLHTLNKIRSLGKISLPESNNASLTLNANATVNGPGLAFDQTYDVENLGAGTLTTNFVSFSVGTASSPRNYTQRCLNIAGSEGLCTLAGTGSFEVWGTITWAGGTFRGTSLASDTVVAHGPLSIEENLWHQLDHRTLVNNQSATFTAGHIRTITARMVNSAAATWDIQTDGDIYEYLSPSGSSTFDNAGTLKKTVGAADAETYSDLVLNNTGLVDVRAGRLYWKAGGTSPGVFNVTAGAELRLSGDHAITGNVCGDPQCTVGADGVVRVYHYETTTFSGIYNVSAVGQTIVDDTPGGTRGWAKFNSTPVSLGTFTMMGGPGVEINSGPFTTPYPVNVYDGAYLVVNTAMTVTGHYTQDQRAWGSPPARYGTGLLTLTDATWRGGWLGFWDSSGQTTVNGTLTIDTSNYVAAISRHTLNTNGSVTWSGSNRLGLESSGSAPATINNTGAWDIQTDADIYSSVSTGQNTINNWGSFRKTAGSAETVVLADINNKNGGVLAVNAGSIFIRYNDLVNDRGGTVIIGLDRRLGVDNTVTNNGNIQHTQSSTANEFALITDNYTTPRVKYHGVLIESAADMGQTTVTVWGNQHCGIALPAVATHLFGDTFKNASHAVLRCYEITPTTPQTADITFYYLANTANPPWPSYWPDERNANTDPYAWHHDGVNHWDFETRGVKNNTANGYRYVQATVVDNYSPFALLDDIPLAVTLADFSAAQVGDHILVTWVTVSELHNAGFNLYRATSEAGPQVRLNATLIPSQSPGNTGGFVYTWEDRRDLEAGATYSYWLEAVALDGSVTRHGPVSVVYQGPTAVTLTGLGAAPDPVRGVPVWWIVVATGLGAAAARLVRRLLAPW